MNFKITKEYIPYSILIVELVLLLIGVAMWLVLF